MFFKKTFSKEIARSCLIRVRFCSSSNMCGPGTPRDKVFIFIVIGALGDENDSEMCWGHLFKSAKCASGRMNPHGNLVHGITFNSMLSHSAISLDNSLYIICG